MATEEKQLPKTVKIDGSYCSHYNAIHHAQFQRKQLELVKGADKTKLKIPDVAMQKWEGEVDEEIDLNEKASGSEHTQTLLKYDEERDRLLTHLFGVIRIHRYSPTKATADAAEKMTTVFKRYMAENIQNESFEDESGHIVGLLKDAAEHTTEIAALGLSDTITKLQTANNAYETLSTQRRSETAATKTERLKVLRPKTDASYEYVCRFIEGAYITSTADDEKAVIEHLVSEMNQVVSDFKHSHNASQAQKKAAKKKKEDDDAPDIHLPEEPKKPDEGGDDIHLPTE